MNNKVNWSTLRHGCLLIFTTAITFAIVLDQYRVMPWRLATAIFKSRHDSRKTDSPLNSCFDVLDRQKYEKSHCTVNSMGINLRDLGSSLNGKLILMIGDSRSMQLFRYIRSLINGRFNEDHIFQNADLFAQFADSDWNISMQYYFKPFPDQATLDIIHQWTVLNTRKPDYLFYESGAWTLLIHGPQGQAEFRENLTEIAKAMARTRTVTIPIWIRTIPIHPKVWSLKSGWAATLYNNTDDLMENFADDLENVARAHNFTVWTSAHRVAKENPQYYRDRVHPGLPMLRLFACQMLTALSNGEKCHY